MITDAFRLWLARARRGLSKLIKISWSGIARGNISATLFFARGKAATAKGDFGVAERYYRRAIEYDPNWADVYVALGNTLIGDGRSFNAIQPFEEALRLEPGRRDAAYGRGMALFTECRCEDAVAAFRDLTQRDPNHQPYSLGLGAALHLSGNMKAAVSAWAKGMEVQTRMAKNASGTVGVRYLPGIFTQAIGHLAQIDIWVKRQLLGLSTTPYVVLAPIERIANRAYLDCWRDHIEVVIGHEADLNRRAQHADDDLTVIKLQDRWMWFLEAGCKIQSLWEEQGRGPLLSLSEQQKERAQAALEALGLPRTAWFVALHVRESAYYRAGMSLISRRSAAIADYVDAIRAVTNRGGWVVRLGDASSAKLPPMPQVIDYAHGPRKDWLDVYLIATARFLIGTNSGPAWAAGTFGVPALLTNWAPLGIQSYFGNTIMLPQLLKSRSGKVLALREQLSEPIAWTDSGRRLAQLGLEPIANSPREIALGVEEMLARTETHGWRESMDDKARRSRFQSLLAEMGIAGRGELGCDFMQQQAAEFA